MASYKDGSTSDKAYTTPATSILTSTPTSSVSDPTTCDSFDTSGFSSPIPELQNDGSGATVLDHARYVPFLPDSTHYDYQNQFPMIPNYSYEQIEIPDESPKSHHIANNLKRHDNAADFIRKDNKAYDLEIDIDGDEKSGQWQFKNARPYQYRNANSICHISTSDGSLTQISKDDWSSSPSNISFCAWEPRELTDKCIDIWSSSLRKSIVEACPDIFAVDSDTCLSPDNLLKNYDALSTYLRKKELSILSDDQDLEELKLFIRVFLQTGDITKILGTFGFEKLYEEGTLFRSHWEDIQQADFERDLEKLDMAFDAAEVTDAKEKTVNTRTMEEDSWSEVTELKARVHKPQNPQDLQYLQDLQKIQYLKELQDLQERQELQKLHYLQKIQDLHYLHYLQNFQEPQDLQDLQELQYILTTNPSAKELIHLQKGSCENRRYAENALKVLVALSDKEDNLVASLLAENWFAGFGQRPVELALRQSDFETARLLTSSDFPLRDAVLADDLQLVNLLLKYEVDPNDGPCFMERPFQTAINHSHLNIALSLWRHSNITDLGNLRAPLQLALLQRDLDQARAVLHQPRTLTADDFRGSSTTMMQVLRANLRVEHDRFLASSWKDAASLDYHNFGSKLQDYRTLWKLGISAMRRLRKDRPPSDFRQVVSLLLVASAMRKTCSIEEFGDYDAFLQDLPRWRNIAVEESRRGLFDEIVLEVWGQDKSLLSMNEGDFGRDKAFLHAFTKEFVGVMELSSISQSSTPHEKSADNEDRMSLDSEGEANDQPRLNPSSATSSKAKDPHLDETNGLPIVPTLVLQQTTTVSGATILRLGAIFAFFIACLLAFRGLSTEGLVVQVAQPSGSFSSLIKTAYITPMLENDLPGDIKCIDEKAKVHVQEGLIRTVADLDCFVIKMARKSFSVDQKWVQSSLRKAIEIGSASLKKALKNWSFQKRYINLALYLGLQPNKAAVMSCIKANPKSSIALELRMLSNALDLQNTAFEQNHSSIPVGSQRPTSSPPANSGSCMSRQTFQRSENGYSALQTHTLLNSSPMQQSHTPLTNRSPSIVPKMNMNYQPTRHKGGIQKRKQSQKPKRIVPLSELCCPHCDKVYLTISNKNRHVRETHPVTEMQYASPRIRYSCGQGCGGTYTLERSRDNHERTTCRNRVSEDRVAAFI